MERKAKKGALKAKRATLKERRENPLYTDALLLKGNNKLLDYDNAETGERIRYAQCNTSAIVCCPFASEGCKAVCYATKGNHLYPSVNDSRVRSTEETKRPDFAEAMTYTIRTEMESKRYKGNTMEIRIHESGDFYSLQYLKKWVQIWKNLENTLSVRYCLYTKSFPFFLMLSDAESDVINRQLESGKLAISFSIDDTTTPAQMETYEKARARYPLANTYHVTENPDNVEHDNVCDCKDCARCGHCLRTDGKTVVVKIHSASASDMETYRANIL